MLFGNVRQLELVAYTHKNISLWIKEALIIAQSNNDGKHSIGDEGVFVVLASVTTEPEADRKAEFHREHIDIQILLEGEERLGYSNTLSVEDKARIPAEDDLYFVDDVENENFVNLKSGDYALFYPGQIHRPLCAIDQVVAIRKAIIKIPVILFSA
ncbi:mannitol dehydrogenase [Psychromonas sp. CNPT3]|uniref:YhcH/YjgK/YiaL family protein n=1 Tax=Psychromonas sp. CNPT3 TaxID=314282 RepID=UPI00006E70C3|nr:YhcH/YjgK/YiaL family protein [Psychromonas sp. CNPT3]AGH80060.1 mannitol dehydrogenase [Psychromonas sp. CNPT3]